MMIEKQTEDRTVNPFGGDQTSSAYKVKRKLTVLFALFKELYGPLPNEAIDKTKEYAILTLIKKVIIKPIHDHRIFLEMHTNDLNDLKPNDDIIALQKYSKKNIAFIIDIENSFNVNSNSFPYSKHIPEIFHCAVNYFVEKFQPHSNSSILDRTTSTFGKLFNSNITNFEKQHPELAKKITRTMNIILVNMQQLDEFYKALDKILLDEIPQFSSSNKVLTTTNTSSHTIVKTAQCTKTADRNTNPNKKQSPPITPHSIEYLITFDDKTDTTANKHNNPTTTFNKENNSTIKSYLEDLQPIKITEDADTNDPNYHPLLIQKPTIKQINLPICKSQHSNTTSTSNKNLDDEKKKYDREMQELRQNITKNKKFKTFQHYTDTITRKNSTLHSTSTTNKQNQHSTAENFDKTSNEPNLNCNTNNKKQEVDKEESQYKSADTNDTEKVLFLYNVENSTTKEIKITKPNILLNFITIPFFQSKQTPALELESTKIPNSEKANKKALPILNTDFTTTSHLIPNAPNPYSSFTKILKNFRPKIFRSNPSVPRLKISQKPYFPEYSTSTSQSDFPAICSASVTTLQETRTPFIIEPQPLTSNCDILTANTTNHIANVTPTLYKKERSEVTKTFTLFFACGLFSSIVYFIKQNKIPFEFFIKKNPLLKEFCNSCLYKNLMPICIETLKFSSTLIKYMFINQTAYTILTVSIVLLTISIPIFMSDTLHGPELSSMNCSGKTTGKTTNI